MTTESKNHDFVYLKMTLSKSLHRAIKAKAKKAGVPISSLVRLALADKYGDDMNRKNTDESLG